MIDFSNCHIEEVSVHHIGNPTQEEDLILSAEPIRTSDLRLRELLASYFFSPFTEEEYHAFTFADGDVSLNPVYRYVSGLLDQTASFHMDSIHMARYLYELSVHPQIKAGDLFVVRLSGVRYENNTTRAIGIFKSEKKQSFLTLDKEGNKFQVAYEDGINIEKLDKGCIVLDIDRETGFKLCIVDKSNKGQEAQFWKDRFLNVRPCQDDYHQTKGILTMTKKYVTDRLTEDFEVSRADQIDLLNRSVDYFKTHETFDQQEFEEKVFGSEGLIDSFRAFDQTYREENELELPNQFAISAPAVKKQARVFKSVLKLDKNFHIYIHGNRDLIEQGTDENGRKFYKIYYDQEL